MNRKHAKRVGVASLVAIGAVAATGLGVHLAGAGSTGTASAFVPIVPCRLVDTRPSDNIGERNGALNPGETLTLAVVGAHGNCSIPAGATGVASNVTVANPTAASFLTVYPADNAKPTSSNVNWTATSSPTPNQVTVGLSTDGAISLFNLAGHVDVIIDIVGYYQPTTSGGGTQGPAGPQGPKGDSGATGGQGPAGTTGATGAAGAAGPAGPKGDTGAGGPSGPKGDPGPTGAAGPQGPKGDTGAQGVAGGGATALVDANANVIGSVAVGPSSGLPKETVLVIRNGEFVPVNTATGRMSSIADSGLLYFTSNDCTGIPGATSSAPALSNLYSYSLTFPATGPDRKAYESGEQFSWLGFSNEFHSAYSVVNQSCGLAGSNGMTTLAFRLVEQPGATILADMPTPLRIVPTT